MKAMVLARSGASLVMEERPDPAANEALAAVRAGELRDAAVLTP